MKIERAMHDPKYKFLMMGDIHINFTDFEPESTGVRLMNGDIIAAFLYFDKATEFYKAWRVMQCK